MTTLRAGWSGVRIPTWTRAFSLLRVHTKSGDHSAFYWIHTGAPLSGVKRLRHEADHTTPRWMGGAILPLLPAPACISSYSIFQYRKIFSTKKSKRNMTFKIRNHRHRGVHAGCRAKWLGSLQNTNQLASGCYWMVHRPFGAQQTQRASYCRSEGQALSGCNISRLPSADSRTRTAAPFFRSSKPSLLGEIRFL